MHHHHHHQRKQYKPLQSKYRLYLLGVGGHLEKVQRRQKRRRQKERKEYRLRSVGPLGQAAEGGGLTLVAEEGF